MESDFQADDSLMKNYSCPCLKATFNNGDYWITELDENGEIKGKTKVFTKRGELVGEFTLAAINA